MPTSDLTIANAESLATARTKLNAVQAQDTYVLRQVSNYTLATNGTGAQQLFNAAAAGTLTIPTGFYEGRIRAYLTGMSGTSGNLGITVGGTAVLTAQLLDEFGFDAASAAAAAAFNGRFASGTLTLAAPMFTAATAQTAYFRAEFSFDCTTAGTFIPQVTLQTAVATAVCTAGSYCILRRVLATATATSSGAS